MAGGGAATCNTATTDDRWRPVALLGVLQFGAATDHSAGDGWDVQMAAPVPVAGTRTAGDTLAVGCCR
jgi:hypothetical protein